MVRVFRPTAGTGSGKSLRGFAANTIWLALTAQAEEVRALSAKVTAAAAEPIKAHVTNGMGELRRAH